jgi:sulfhydrogenase subunit beta (sulfur reductase)
MERKHFFCTPVQFEKLLDAIKDSGYKLLGPKVEEETIILDELASARDLPIGWTDEQSPGKYRLKPRGDAAYFGYNLGPHSWKKYLFPPKEKLWTAKRQEDQRLVLWQEVQPQEKLAFIGVRACEMQGILVLDKVFSNTVASSSQYQRRRENLFIVAVNCTTAAGTCFCVSMNAGPTVDTGYDLSLTEVIDPPTHFFVVASGSCRGEVLLSSLDLRDATPEECLSAKIHVDRTVDMMVRHVDNANVPAMLMDSWDAHRWDKVAERCINCANCTLACPTCFCSDVQEEVSMDGTHAERWQRWESCFNLSHSYIHGGSIRSTASSRYRQWLTHKFGTWWQQFGVSGCIGCGRCIAWCPVGIYVTEELALLQLEKHEEHK